MTSLRSRVTSAFLSILVLIASGTVLAKPLPLDETIDTAPSGISPEVPLLPYVSQDAVWLMSPDGAYRWCVTPQARSWEPVLSGDGTRLAYWALGRHGEPREDASGELWVLDLRSSRSRVIASSSMPTGALAWSVDGRRLAWVSSHHLVVSDLDGNQRTLSAIGFAGMEPPRAVWSPHGTELICASLQDDVHGLWSIDASTGVARLLAELSPDEWPVYAVSGDGKLAYLHRGSLWLLRDTHAGAEPERVSSLDIGAEVVTQLAWSPDDSRLVLVGADGNIRIAATATWAWERPIGIGRTVTGVWWLDATALACWVRTEGAPSETVVLINTTSGLTSFLTAPTLPATIPDQANAMGGGQCAALPYDWYRYQGEWDSGAMAHNNCGPTCVAMAIQFARNNLWVPISSIRDYIGGSSWTYPSHLESALSHWEVPYRRLYSMSDIRDALTLRNSIVLVHLWMYWITPGSDYLLAYSAPALHYGRYYSYDQSHWVVLKGLTSDGVWGICHDPNVWDGNGLYWYSGGVPKGKDRYYRYTELANSITDYGYQAIEVLAPAGATPTPTPTSTPTPTATPTQTSSPTSTATATPSPLPPTATATPTGTPGGSAYILGSVYLQGRPPAPDPRWVTTLEISLLRDGLPLATEQVTTDDSGEYTAGPFAPGTYDVRVKNFHTLSNLLRDVVLLVGDNPVQMGELREGDANDDNMVDIDDFAILKQFYSTSDPRADFNQDGVVDIDDFAWIKENFGHVGDSPFVGSSPFSPIRPIHGDNGS